MIVFLDTNIFFGNWYIKGAKFTYLFNYIKNTNSKLLLSELVVLEVESIYKRDYAQAVQDLKRSTKELNFFLRDNLECDLKEDNHSYEFKEILGGKFDDTVFLPFDSIDHKMVVERALKRKRPFQQNEKGYRDTLIWLSFLNFLKTYEIDEEVAFLTKNVNDFFEKNRRDFLTDLKEDIKELGIKCTITPYDSLFAFVDSRVDKLEHKYSREEVYKKFLCDVEFEIEFEISALINILSLPNFKHILRHADPYLPRFEGISKFSFDVIEGIEDAQLIGHKVLTDNVLSIKASFNLRRCGLSITVPTSEYYLNSEDIDPYYDVSIENEDAVISYTMRPDFEVVYEYNIELKEVEVFEINEMEFFKRKD